ncbi:GTPase [Streptomyces sp. NPDC001381]|uniref:GTPase n=1 Tax=Streptomyces sp. NPDC001381 TaxID=3364567 RepID=UPI00369989B9
MSTSSGAEDPRPRADGDPEDWADRARTAVREALGPVATAALEGAWAARESDPDVSVLLYGPQNAGKTSLLRRLLLEDGAGVPDWAAVSGGKETFETDEVRRAGLRYVDSPGLHSGDALHTERAEAALLEADAVLLVLDRRLFGGAAAHLLHLVSGAWIHAGRPQPLPAGALLPVVAQADRWGADVGGEDFAGLVAVVRGEFRSQLSAAVGPHHVPDLHVVVADTAGLSAGIPNEELRLEHYLDVGEHDGVAALRKALLALPARRTELRAAARIRFWCRQAFRALDAVRTPLAEAEASLEGARRLNTRCALLENRLDAARDAGRADLRDIVRRELLRAADSAVSAEAAEQVARDRLVPAVRSWQTRWTGDVQQLALKGEADAVTVRAGPGMRAFNAYLDDIRAVLATPGAPAPGPSGSADTTTALVLGVGSLTHVVEHEVRRRRHEQVTEALNAQDKAPQVTVPGQVGDPADSLPAPAVPDPYPTLPVSDPYGYGAPTEGTPQFSDPGTAVPGVGAEGQDVAHPPMTDSASAFTVPDPPVGHATGSSAPADPSALGDSIALVGEQALVIAVTEIRDLLRRTRAEKTEHRRAGRRAAAEKATERIAGELEGPWLEAVDHVRAGIRRRRPATATVTALEREGKHLDGAAKRLEALLREVPL